MRDPSSKDNSPLRELPLGVDALRFETLQRQFRAGELSEAHNRLVGTITPPLENELTHYAGGDSHRLENARRIGIEALHSRKVMSLILAGGMATRFGGVVKAEVEVCAGQTFFDLKVRDLMHCEKSYAALPVAYFMTSKATHSSIEKLVQAAAHKLPETKLGTVEQSVSLRMTADGEVFFEDGVPSTYAPGHGDVVDILARNELWPSGVEYCLLANVDNLGATIDPVLIGLHILSQKPISAEIVRKNPGDKGGAPARPEGQGLQIVEQFRFPESVDQDAFPYFNTNTFIFSKSAFADVKPLTWFCVQKKVDGRECIQLERLVGELTAQKPTHFIAVEREGLASRFLPVKDVPELDRRRNDIQDVLTHRGIL